MALERNIGVAVTGGIAAYKTCELVRELKKAGAQVRVAMTESARRFVSELTFASLSEQPVVTSLFEDGKTGITHIELARWCDLLVVCPATANMLGKVANGLADEVVSTTVLACKAPVIFCPAMNSAMWANPILQKNVMLLRDHGYELVEPEWGPLATRSEGEGWGRLAALSRILAAIDYRLNRTHKLENKRVLVTAGPTIEAIDPVRYITNHSSGKMGFALAEAARRHGATVTLIAGPNQLERPEGIKYLNVNTVEEMQQAVEREHKSCDILIMAAAVSDYRPKQAQQQKMKKTSDELTLELVKTADILGGLQQRKGHRIHVGFAVETENGLSNATKKLHSKNLDLVVLNNPLEPGAGFKADTNVVTFVTGDGATEPLSRMSKREVADAVLKRVTQILETKSKQAAAV